MITYRVGNELDLGAVLELYRASTLGERRPVNDRERFQNMLKNANLVVTAWDDSLMVGIARSLSDFSYVTYVSDLAVRVSHQKRGIGRELLRQTREAAGPQSSLVLFAAPAAEHYYARIGFKAYPQGWKLEAGTPL